MYQVGICGHFAQGHNLLNGQTLKTTILAEELKSFLGASKIKTIDTFGWKRNPLLLFIKCLALIKNCENIIVSTAYNGVRVFIPMFLALNRIFHRRLHYVVIGGWLPEVLEKNKRLRRSVGKFDGVYIETGTMAEDLRTLGVNNAILFPNFKRLKILKAGELFFPSGPPYKLCTFSRVTDKKGIEDAVEVVTDINTGAGKTVYVLDIYGPIDPDYAKRFEKLKQSFPDYVSYKGAVGYSDSVDTIKNYFLLLFPTHHATEGIPGTVIDAYAAGVPVIASGWKSASELVIPGETGFVYSFMQKDVMRKILQEILENTETVSAMKLKCLSKAREFSPESVISKFVKDVLNVWG